MLASIALWCISLCLVCITVDKLDSGLVDLFQYLNVEKGGSHLKTMFMLNAQYGCKRPWVPIKLMLIY